jgi:hypothetical protein
MAVSIGTTKDIIISTGSGAATGFVVERGAKQSPADFHASARDCVLTCPGFRKIVRFLHNRWNSRKSLILRRLSQP